MPAAYAFALVASLLLLFSLLVLRPTLLVRHLLVPLLPGVIFCGDGRRRELALTIDDGPSPPSTAHSPGQSDTGIMALLDLLRELQVPTTLFVISGHLERGDPAYLERALADGHGIGHHMNEDSVSAHLSPEEFRQAFDQAARLIQSAAEPTTLLPRWFRPGGGWIRPSMLRTITMRGYQLVLGSIFPWDTFRPSVGWMGWFVLTNAHPGAARPARHPASNDGTDTPGGARPAAARLPIRFSGLPAQQHLKAHLHGSKAFAAGPWNHPQQPRFSPGAGGHPASLRPLKSRRLRRRGPNPTASSRNPTARVKKQPVLRD